MVRTESVIVAVFAGILLLPGSGEGQGGGLRLGEKFEGKVGEVVKGYPWPGFVDTFYGHSAEIPVTLKAGQSISVSVTVTGKERKVSVALQDPTGKMIAATKRNTEVKTAQFTAEEVNDTGKYKIIVISDRTGPFTLRAKGSSDTGLDEKALKARIDELEEELADLKRKLKAAQDKKGVPGRFRSGDNHP